jgi:hypothetical protein
MLSAPKILLKISLAAFLIGIGIYLGKLYSAKFVLAYGSGLIVILVSYIVSTFFGLAIFYMAQSIKALDATWFKRVWNLRDLLENITLQPHNQTPTEREIGERERNLPIQDPSITPSNLASPSASVHGKHTVFTGQSTFHQSVHSRDSGRVHYTLNSTEGTQASTMTANVPTSADSELSQTPSIP